MKVLDKVRASLNARGRKTIRSLGRAFKIYESMDGCRKIDKQEFYWGLKDTGANITKHQAEILLEFMDTQQDGTVNYDEFLFSIRGRPSERRQAEIDRAFAKFDKDGCGSLCAADLSVVYNAVLHPKVLSGDMTCDEVFTEFLACFGDKHGDG